ncbi:MAG: glucoamylase family protein [Planctomycetota bacterium]
MIRFDNPLDNLAVPESQFGVFKPEEPGHVLRASQRWQSIDRPDRARPVGLLRLEYSVPRLYLGWWLKLGGGNWTRYRDGFLTLRLRMTEKTPPLFKLELKTAEGGPPHFVYVRLTRRHHQESKLAGFADVAVAISDFRIRDLSHLTELVIVLEADRLPRPYRQGELLIESIRLVTKREQFRKRKHGAPDAKDPPTLLDDLGQLAFEWFQVNRHPQTGMVLDRSPNRRRHGLPSGMSSIAGAGYHLSLLPQWVRQGWLSQEEAERQAIVALKFALSTLPHHHGLFYHFVDIETGRRHGQSEISILDSAIFFNGAMVAAQAFGGETARLADALIDRADWPALLTRHPTTGKPLLSLGWTPEKGLLTPADVRSSEMAMPYFLAVGSRTHPIQPDCWYNTDVVRGRVAGYEILNPAHPLFTALYGLGWHDLKGWVGRDGVDLDANARVASVANRAFCRQLADQFSTFRPDAGGWWAISAGDAPAGYIAPGPIREHLDGTVWPLAALASLPWMEKELEADLKRWRSSATWQKVCGPYGLAPFNLDRDWVGNDLLAIDLGSFALALANLRNRTVWNLWMRHPVAKAALGGLGYAKRRAVSH